MDDLSERVARAIALAIADADGEYYGDSRAHYDRSAHAVLAVIAGAGCVVVPGVAAAEMASAMRTGRAPPPVVAAVFGAAAAEKPGDVT